MRPLLAGVEGESVQCSIFATQTAVNADCITPCYSSIYGTNCDTISTAIACIDCDTDSSEDTKSVTVLTGTGASSTIKGRG